MRTLFASSILPLFFAAGCSREPASTNDVDIATAADTARGSVDNYAALPDHTPSPKPASTRQALVPEPMLAPKPTATPLEAESAEAAVTVVRQYYELIGAGRYAQAWQLWDDDGRASEMSEEAFAASFAKYADYHAAIGAPGRIDAGAGQRYITVPVRVSGRLKDGARSFAIAGPVTLHRVADIDGATPAQRNWRISASGVRPRPDELAPARNPETPDRVTTR